MTIEYVLTKQDILTAFLFNSSISKRINKKKNNGKLFLIGASLIVSILSYFQKNYFLAIYCGIVALVFFIFYSKYFIWRYKKHYLKYIDETFSNVIGANSILKLQQDGIYTFDKTRESKINIQEIERVDEIDNLFLLPISSGQSIIIPKRFVVNEEKLKEEFQSLGWKIESYKKSNWI